MVNRDWCILLNNIERRPIVNRSISSIESIQVTFWRANLFKILFIGKDKRAIRVSTSCATRSFIESINKGSMIAKKKKLLLNNEANAESINKSSMISKKKKLLNNEANTESTNKNSTIAKKKELLREIEELQCVIKQYEWELDKLRFPDVEEHVTEIQSLYIPSHSKEIPNVEVDLQNDLYNFAGFRCVKFRRQEVVFEFTATSEQQKDTYAIQIFINRNGKFQLGKWILPMSIDVNDILAKKPINGFEDLIHFQKICKHHIDCYIARQEQFLMLKKRILHMKNCTLQSDMGYTYIILELYSVHDRENNRYMNLIIYLLYQSDTARPYKINIDTKEENMLHDNLRQKLKKCLNEFKISDLQTAFDNILTEDSTFTWIQTNDSDSPLELNDTSSSSESFIAELQLVRKKSQRINKKRNELRKKWNVRKRRKNILTNELSDNEENSKTQTKVADTKSPQQTSIRKKDTEAVPSTSKQQKVYRNFSEETPLHKPKIRFKQTKLNFQTNQSTNLIDSINENSSLISKPHNNPDKKKLRKAPLGTSTPLYHNARKSRISSSSSLDIDSITDIETPMQAEDKLNDSQRSKLIGIRTIKTNQGHMRSIRNKNVRK